MQQIDLTKTCRIGIDYITLYNFEIKKMGRVNQYKEFKDDYVQETLHLREQEIFSIDSSIRTYTNGKTIEFKTLKFNPNKILYSHNIYNSRAFELNLCLEKLYRILKAKEIEIDLSNALIKDIELNINFNVSYRDYYEVFLLFFNQIENSKYFGKVIDSKKFKKKVRPEGFFHISKYKEVKVYDKQSQVKSLKIQPLTRLEYKFNRPAVKFFFNKLNLEPEKTEETNKFKYLLDNDKIIDEMFKYYCKKDFVSKSFDFIESNIKRTLETEYTTFKRNNEIARKYKRKEKRDVYKHLSKFWIFDRIFVIDLIKEYDKAHFTREKERIKNKFPDHENLEKFNEIVGKII